MKTSRQTLLLIHAPVFQDYGPMKGAAGRYFPLGLGYIAACAKQAGYDVEFIDPNVQDVRPEDMARRVQEIKPLLVGISFMTPQFFRAKELADIIKETCPNVPIVMGGAHPSVQPSNTLKEIPASDYACFGDGEETVVELLQYLEEGQEASPEGIRGIAWRDGENIKMNMPRGPVADLDALPFPEHSIIDQTLYKAQSFLAPTARTGSIYTSRGCPWKCTFCCSGSKLSQKIRFRSVDNVMAEIDHLVENYNINYLLIKDDTFTMKKSRVKEFCTKLKGRHPGLTWHCMGRVDTVNEESLIMMKEAGLKNIFFGVESGNDEILKSSQKGITKDQVRKATALCDKLGIHSYGAFIIGLPGESEATIRETIDYACTLPLTMAGFSILIPYPGTQVYDDYCKKDDSDKIDYSQFIASTGLHFVNSYTGLVGLTPDQLPAFVSLAQRRFYLRPTQIYRMLRLATMPMLAGYTRGAIALARKEIYRLITHKTIPYREKAIPK